MNKNNVILTSVFVIVLVIVLILVMRSGPFDYHIRDFFADSSSQGKVVFMFVEVNEYNPIELENLSLKLINEHESTVMENDSSLLLVLAHYFNPEDVTDIPEEMKEQLQQQYPSNEGIEKLIDYIDEGYIYSGISQKIEGLAIPQDSLFKSPFIIPKEGVKAREVIRHTKILK